MSDRPLPADCRFCSQVSKANGEDPIGSVEIVDDYLLIEATPPWPTTLWLEADPMPPEVTALVREINGQGGNLRPLAIAPDREYSPPGYVRVLHYRRPERLFTQFEPREYLVPAEQADRIGPLAIALLKHPDQLADFEPYRHPPDSRRDILVCTHGNFDVACSRFGYPLYEKLRNEYATDGQLRVWRCSHFGGHQFAPTLIDLPDGRYWGHLDPEVLDLLVGRQGSLSQLYRYYRGWAGLTQFEQIAEREIWMREGWHWLRYRKAGQVLAIDEQDQSWAEVRLDFVSPDGSVSGAYEARIETCGQVMTMWDSGDEDSLEEIKQYCVSRLVKVT